MFSKTCSSEARSNSKRQSNGHQARSERYGLIILGNSGVGKSFLANICLQNEAFEHKCKPSAVTKITEYEELYMDGKTYVIFNIPGLVEAKQEQIDVNKQEIDKAFQTCPNSIVIYVFGAQQGRIRSEDVVAFNALHAAYPFNPKSLVIVVNGIPPERDGDYEGETTILLREMLQMKDACKTMCFLDQVDKKKPEDIMKLSDQLFQAILNSFPKVHKKQHSIDLDIDKIKDLKSVISGMQDKFNQEREKMLADFRKEQKEYDAEMEKQRKQYKEQLEEHKEATDRLTKQMTSYEEQNEELKEEIKKQQKKREESDDDDDLFSNPFTGMVAGFIKGLGKIMK